MRSCVALILSCAACGGGDPPATDAPASHDAADPDAAPDAATTERLTIPFAARVNGAPFACGQTYAGVGSTAAAYTAIDFRFFVHDVTLVTADGDVPLTLDVDAFQTADGIALLDFENGGTGCQMGTVATHPALTGTVPIGTVFTGMRLTIGIPFAKNHLDATLALPPLNVPAMFWAWSSGYKFIKADGVANGSGFSLHVGSTGCSATGSMAPAQPCTSPNTIPVTLTGLTPTSTIVADVGRLLTDVDITTNTMDTAPGCMSFPGDPECNTVMPKLALPYGAFPAEPQQRFLSIE
ncbi:MAG: metallo-mystery pair system four-Cys motif protein [Deltaproteobacteria bacterium]|nr:metallo-mystery pair system four-Cys motif protein [Deltaproteobacteria bacterium]